MELPVIDFIRARITEADPTFDTRPGTAYYEMFVKPQELMLQPLENTLDQVLVSQSIKRILDQPDPDSYSEEDVDDLVANLYVTRDVGGYASTVVRIYYDAPKSKDFPTNTAEFTFGDLSFFNTEDISITAEQMALNTEGTFYYIDVPVQSQLQGEAYNAKVGEITAFLNDTESIRVTNLSDAVGGLDRETNTQLLTRAQNSIGVRDLETEKGINAILNEKFPFIQKIKSIGMGDQEMQRDILYNVHVGGKTDVYIKTPSFETASQDFIGMDYDYTRQIQRTYNVQMARSAGDVEYPAYTGTSKIVVGTVTVKEDVIETAATLESVAIPSGTGINLTGAEWLKLTIDGVPNVLVKVSGAIVAQTQRFEIINSINAAMGYQFAIPSTGNKIRLSSLVTGVQSIITFSDTSPQSQAGNVLFGVSTYPTSFYGLAAEEYVENTDYTVDYINGLIYQMPLAGRVLPTILSGQTMIAEVSDGLITQTGLNYFFESVSPGRFLDVSRPAKVRVGDEVTITQINGATTGTVIGDLPQTFIVSDVLSTTKLSLADFYPTATDINIDYEIKSNQVVVVDYKYNPISIDIGGQVLLSDGLLRGVRPGRTNYTIQNTPFIDILSIQQIDPESGEAIEEPLRPPRGYGYGGYGEGGYGVGAGGDYELSVLAPRDRFSVFDDLVILLKEDTLSSSYRVTYRWASQIPQIHDLSRNDAERVTGADVLPKHFVPALFDVNVEIKRDPTNIETPSNEDLATMISEFINTKSGLDGVQASDISKMLEAEGVDRVKTPFVMTATVLNTDGSTEILESEDLLTYPDVVLPSDTDSFATNRIIHFYPNNITVSEVS
jgi:hypothetical protein